MTPTNKFNLPERKPIKTDDMPEEMRKVNACYETVAIPIEMIQANDYNPNAVATEEMRLLYVSIKEDTYTMPTVVIYDDKLEKYIIVDGFHRYATMLRNKDIYERNDGYLPCVVIKKNIAERMASTIRHNRARGKHSIMGDTNVIRSLKEQGMSEEEISNKLGFSPVSVVRHLVTSGYAKKFADHHYGKAWESEQQLKAMREYYSKERRKEHEGTTENRVEEGAKA